MSDLCARVVLFFGMRPVIIDPDFDGFGYFHGLPLFGKKFDIDSTAEVNIMISVTYLQ
jgi:hypothetical protein